MSDFEFTVANGKAKVGDRVAWPNSYTYGVLHRGDPAYFTGKIIRVYIRENQYNGPSIIVQRDYPPDSRYYASKRYRVSQKRLIKLANDMYGNPIASPEARAHFIWANTEPHRVSNT